VYVEGKLKTRNWTDKEGVTRYTTEVVADTVQPLGSRPNGENENNEFIAAKSDVDFTENNDSVIKDDLPF